MTWDVSTVWVSTVLCYFNSLRHGGNNLQEPHTLRVKPLPFSHTQRIYMFLMVHNNKGSYFFHIALHFFLYLNTGIDIKIPVFGTNLKNNCLWFIHIRVIKSTKINHWHYWICNWGIVINNKNLTETCKRHVTQIRFTRHFVAHKRESEYCMLMNNFRDCCTIKI